MGFILGFILGFKKLLFSHFCTRFPIFATFTHQNCLYISNQQIQTNRMMIYNHLKSIKKFHLPEPIAPRWASDLDECCGNIQKLGKWCFFSYLKSNSNQIEIQPIYRNRSGNFHILKNKSINSKHIERIEARYCNMTPTWKNELGSSLVTRGLTSEVDFQIS